MPALPLGNPTLRKDMIFLGFLQKKGFANHDYDRLLCEVARNWVCLKKDRDDDSDATLGIFYDRRATQAPRKVTTL